MPRRSPRRPASANRTRARGAAATVVAAVSRTVGTPSAATAAARRNAHLLGVFLFVGKAGLGRVGTMDRLDDVDGMDDADNEEMTGRRPPMTTDH